jgi:hypothetical protein
VALAGALLALLEGAARLGAGVGGVILVGFAFAVAAATLLPGAATRRRLLIVLLSPVAALVVLAVVDLATAGGGGHFTGSILHARSASDLREVLVRRYEAAWRELRSGGMPLASLAALAAAAAALRWRARLLSPVRGDPAWLAALYGSLAAGVVGSLVDDSGPVLLLVAVFTGACALLPVGAPAGSPAHSGQAPRSPISCSEPARGTRSLRLLIARSSSASLNGLTSPHCSQTR